MPQIEKKSLAEKEVVLQYAPVKMVAKVVDGETINVPAHDPKPLVTVTLRELTAMEAMDADDLALSMSKTGRPAIARIIKTYAVYCVVAVKDAQSPKGESVSPKANAIEFTKLIDRLGVNLVDRLALEYREFSEDLEKMSDPKPSPADTPSE